MGFGWSFYGFFVAAAIWITLYFIWAIRADDKPNQPPPRRRRSAEAQRAKAEGLSPHDRARPPHDRART
jgi:hypothetical protein